MDDLTESLMEWVMKTRKEYSHDKVIVDTANHLAETLEDFRCIAARLDRSIAGLNKAIDRGNECLSRK